MTEEDLRRGLLAILDQPQRAWHAAWCWPIVRDARDAYGTTQARLFPTRADMHLADQVEPLLCALGQAEGRTAIHSLFAWAKGIPTWRIAKTNSVGPRAMRYRLKRWMQALGVTWREREPPPHPTSTAPAKGTTTENVVPLRVWSNGYVRNGHRGRASPP